MQQRIKRVDVSAVERGMYVVQEDAEGLTDAQINEDWDASEQDWQRVVRAQHRADQSQLTLAMYNGEEFATGWGEGAVWALWDADADEPVLAEEERP